MKEMYSREVGTDLIERDKLAEIVDILRKYLEKKHYCVISDRVIEGLEFKVKGEDGTKYGRVGVKIMGKNRAPGITYSRFQQTKPESPLGLNYHIRLEIGYARARRDSVDKIVDKILALHPLLKEQKN